MKKTALFLPFLFLILFTRAAAAQWGCATRWEDARYQGAAQQGKPINIYPTDGSFDGVPGGRLFNALAEGASKWLETCKDASYPNIADFYLHHGTPGSAENVLMINYKREEKPRVEGGVPRPADYGNGRIDVYGKCDPQYPIQGIPCENGYLNWDTEYGRWLMAHELGHAQGLGHDSEAGACATVRGMMRAVPKQNPGFLTDYCRGANERNCSPDAAGTTCPSFKVSGTVNGLVNGESINVRFKATVDGKELEHIVPASFFAPGFSSERLYPSGTSVALAVSHVSNTNKTCTIAPGAAVINNGDYGGVTVTCVCTGTAARSGFASNDAGENCFPDGEDPFENVIDRQPGACEFCWQDDPWWTVLPGPPTGPGPCKRETKCSPGKPVCVDFDDDGDGIMDRMECYDSIDCKDQCVSQSSLTLNGPTVGFNNPRYDQSISGRTYISGTVTDPQGVQSLDFFVDGYLVTLENFQSNLYSPDGCAAPTAPRPCNQNIGFSGWLDVSNLPAGKHYLEILSTDADPDYPVPTYWQMPVQVNAGCTDATAPAVAIKIPVADAKVGGEVGIEVTATDNDRVASVTLLVDGQAVREDTIWPYSFVWNSRNVPDGTYTLTAIAVDPCGKSATSAPVTVQVLNAAGRDPRAKNDVATTYLRTPITINVLANDSDPDGETVSLGEPPLVTAPANGSVEVSGTSLRYTPGDGFAGNDRFQYRIRDTTGRGDRAWVTVSVSADNRMPAARDDAASTITGNSVTINVVSNDSDADGDAVRLIQSPIIDLPDKGHAQRFSKDEITYTPYDGFTGTDRFQYEVADGRGGTSRAWATVTITDANRAPVAMNDSAATTPNTPVSIKVTSNDSDPDGDDVNVVSKAITRAPSHGAAVRVSGTTIAYTPAQGFSGTDSFEYEVGDGRGRRARATVTVTTGTGNTPPDVADDAVSVAPGASVTINVTANDSDADGDRVTLTADPIKTPPANGRAVKVSSTSITYTAMYDFEGVVRFEYEAADQRGALGRAWVEVTVSANGTVNHGPVALDDAAFTKPNTAVVVAVVDNDTDANGDPVRLGANPITMAPRSGTAARVDDRSIRYTPSTGFVGTDTFQYEAEDGRGLKTRGWVSVTVSDANNRPTAYNDAGITSRNLPIDVLITVNDRDPDGDELRVISTPVTVAAQNGAVELMNDWTLRYTPDEDFVGTDRFEYEIDDLRGGRAKAWVSITTVAEMGGDVSEEFAANAPPVAVNDYAMTGTDVELVLEPLVNDSDPDNDPITLSAEGVVTKPQFGVVRRLDDRRFLYMPFLSFAGNDTFQYEIVDGRGGRARAWVSVQVPGTNHPPAAHDDFASVALNRSVAVDVIANDTDADADVLELTARAVVRGPRYGTVRRESTRRLVYTPFHATTGRDELVYEITDGKGTAATATLFLAILGESDPPVARNDAFTVESNVVAALNVLANDTDPDGDALRVVSSTQPLHGTVSWDSDTQQGTYVSHRDYAGADSFTYTIADAAGLESTATVSVTVTPARRAPVVANDSVETKTRTAILIGVLANDYDPNWGEVLKVKSVTQPARGTVVINASQSVTYTPAADFAGTATFTYVAADPGGLESTGTVTVKVLNGAPVPKSEILAASEDLAIGYSAWNVLANDTDPDGDELKIVLIEQPVHGTFQLSADFSQFAYRSKADWSGMDSFHYTVSDPFGATVRLMSQISVKAVNDAPVCGNDTASTWKNQVLTIPAAQLFANDSDLEGNTLAMYSVTAGANGQVQLLPDGSVQYTPHGEFTGTDTFTYRAQDGLGGYGDGTVTVTVRQDTAPVAQFSVTCNGRACTFDASASTDDRGIVAYQWTLGNNTPANGKTFPYTYPLAGSYAVRLTVYDALGQVNILQKTVLVSEPPPDAVNDLFSFPKGYNRWIAYADMLRNDTDPNGDPLTVVSTNAANTTGTLTCDTTGCLFAPFSKYWYGQTTFTYTISDGHGKTDTATVTIDFRY